MIQDLRSACRQLFKAPGFTLAAIATLALGIGATTAIYSVLHAIVLRPLPYPQAEQIFSLRSAAIGKSTLVSNVAPPDYLDWQREASSFAALAATQNASVNLTGEGEPRRLRALRVTANYWQVFGLPALHGRVFTAESNQPGADTLAVISHGAWQQQFGGDPALVGRTVQLNSRAVTIIGIMPAAFQAADRTDLWLPLAFTEEEKSNENRGAQYLRVVGRLKPDVAAAAAQAEMALIAERIATAFPNSNKDVTVQLRPLLDELVGNLRPVLYTLLAAVGALLLIACVNVANLLLARATSRQRELSVRSALGASPARIIRQLLTESVVLATAGGVLGVLVAYWGVDALVAVCPADLPRTAGIGIDGPVLLVTTGITVFCGLAFGLVPALHCARLNLVESLKDGGRGNAAGAGARHHRLRQGLVIAEVALALTLLVSASLLMQSFLRLLGTSPGFRIEETYNFGLALPAARYDTPEKQTAFIDAVITRLRALPGVQSAGTVHTMPLTGSAWTLTFKPSTRMDLPESDWPAAGYFMISPDYLQAIGIPLLQGRYFTAADRGDSAPVALISRSLAEKYYPGVNPLGQRIAISNTDRTVWREIVGIVGDIRQRTLEADPVPQVYEPVAQRPFGSMGVVVHAPHAPAGFADSLRAAVKGIDPDLPLIGLGSVDELVARSLATRRFFTVLLGVFTAIALLLAAVGIYGVMAFSVTQRTAEYGVRLALGATPGGIRRLVLQRAGRLVAAGFALGILGALGTGRLLTSLLFGVSPFEPLPYLAAMALFAAVAFLACWLPARRATRVDPMLALRAE